MHRQSLLAYNTFGMDVTAERYLEVTSSEVIGRVVCRQEQPFLVLGGGSNILFTKDPEALVLHNRILGKKLQEEAGGSVVVSAGGGENWHDFVLWTLRHNWGGIENLSLIPGTVGAAPIQNIGAYGVELKDVFHSLEAVDLQTGKELVFKPEDCDFAYRSSIFKTAYKGQLLITRVFFRLSSVQHSLHTDYGAIRETLAEWEIEAPTIQDISRAVVAIRQSKLPDPAVLGNAGSFFKNPEIDAEQFAALQQRFPGLLYYALPDGRYKIPAGWLIDQCGWKGKRLGPVGCYEQQALVLVNYGGATADDVLSLAAEVMDSVESRYGIRLEPEVNIV